MGKGEPGVLIGAAIIGIVGSFAITMLAEWADLDVTGRLILRFVSCLVPPVVAARVAYATGFDAGRRMVQKDTGEVVG